MPTRCAHFLTAVLVVAFSASAAAAFGGEPVAHIEATKATPIRIQGLTSQQTKALAELKLEELQKVLTVHVRESEVPQVSVLGNVELSAGALRFLPRFPLQPGLEYVVKFRLADSQVDQVVALPPADKSPRGEVTGVFPTAREVPQNLLKFYIHFSVPMSRGEAYSRVHLYDDEGKELKKVFLQVHGELWDPYGQRFTLLFDPGRVKRELKPRLELGPPLEEGRTYELVVDRNWQDAEGRPLKSDFRRTLRVGPPDFTQPDAKAWRWSLPEPQSQEPLELSFREPLDHAMLQRVIQVRSSDERAVSGTVHVARQERKWRFVPDEPWQSGKYSLRIDAALEDRAGNSLGRLFEVDEFRQVERQVVVRYVTLPFEIK